VARSSSHSAQSGAVVRRSDLLKLERSLRRDAVYPLKAKGVPLNHEKAFAALNLPGDPESKMRVILAGQFTEAG
jgi:hypothetical protein